MSNYDEVMNKLSKARPEGSVGAQSNEIKVSRDCPPAQWHRARARARAHAACCSHRAARVSACSQRGGGGTLTPPHTHTQHRAFRPNPPELSRRLRPPPHLRLAQATMVPKYLEKVIAGQQPQVSEVEATWVKHSIVKECEKKIKQEIEDKKLPDNKYQELQKQELEADLRTLQVLGLLGLKKGARDSDPFDPRTPGDLSQRIKEEFGDNTSTTGGCQLGVIDFLTAGKKQAAFMTVGEKMANTKDNAVAFKLVQTLVEEFGLTTPRLILSVTSTKYDGDVDDNVKRVLRAGFEELEGAWIITSGFNAGASKAVGEIVAKIRETKDKTELEMPVIGRRAVGTATRPAVLAPLAVDCTPFFPSPTAHVAPPHTLCGASTTQRRNRNTAPRQVATLKCGCVPWLFVPCARAHGRHSAPTLRGRERHDQVGEILRPRCKAAALSVRRTRAG